MSHVAHLNESRHIVLVLVCACVFVYVCEYMGVYMVWICQY